METRLPSIPRSACLLVVVLLGAGVALSLLNAVWGIGGAAMGNVFLPVFRELVLAGAVVAIAFRAVRVRRDRGAWTAIGCGAAAWMAGDIYRLFAFPAG